MLEVAGRNVLVVMARYPTPGVVKTRLAAHVGADNSCALYRAFLLDIRQRFAAAPWVLVWAVHPPGADLAGIVGPRASCIAQTGSDLGARMAACFSELYAQGAARVVMIGADAPHLAPQWIADAFAALADVDVILAPTFDGGYCLIGMRAPFDLFAHVEMGTSRVLSQTLASAEARGYRVRCFEETFDVDELDDVERLWNLLRSGTISLPETERVLRSWPVESLQSR